MFLVTFPLSVVAWALIACVWLVRAILQDVARGFSLLWSSPQRYRSDYNSYGLDGYHRRRSRSRSGMGRRSTPLLVEEIVAAE